MQIEQQLCSVQGHEGCNLTHICSVSNCSENSRYMCDKCIKEIGHHHDHNCEFKQNIMEIENFIQYLKEQRLPQIELRQRGNQAKLKYFTKIYEEYQSGVLQQIPYLRDIIQDLLKEYQNDIVQTQLQQDIYNTPNCLKSLNIQKLNMLLDNQLKFINEESTHISRINKMIDLFQESYDLGNDQFIEFRRINEYLDIQQYSINGRKFIFDGEEFQDGSFFSKCQRYFATINKNKDKFIVRKQFSLDITYQQTIRSKFKKIKLDPSFQYCVIQGQEGDIFYYYIRMRNQFKLMKKFKLEQVQDFIVSNQNHIIIFLKEIILTKALNFKNQLIKQIQFSYKQGNFCYGMQNNIIAINNLGNISIYEQVKDKKWQLILQSPVNQEFSDMIFTNNYSQLVTKDKQYIKLWQIEYGGQKINQINKITIQKNFHYYFQSKTEFSIIVITQQEEIQIFDKNFNLSLSLKNFNNPPSSYNALQLTKHFLIISYKDGRTQVIKLRFITDYERLCKQQ